MQVMETYPLADSPLETCHGFNEALRQALEAAPQQYVDQIRLLEADMNQSYERHDFVEHAWRTKEIVERYAGGEVPDVVPHLALIHDIVGRMYEPGQTSDDLDPSIFCDRRSLATSVVADILTQPGIEMEITESNRSYILCVLGDTIELEAMAEQYRERLSGSAQLETLADTLRCHRSKSPIESEVWQLDGPQLDIDHLTETCESVNIEAIIIKAAEMLDNVSHPPQNERALLEDILEIETFHAPLCEVLGLSSLAMQLRSEARMRRLEKSGYHEVVDQAETMRRTAVEAGLASIIETIYGQPLDEESVAGDIKDDTKVIKVAREDAANHLISRIKAPGSLAEKLRRDPRLPMDLVGLTLVLESDLDVGEKMADTLRVLEQNPCISLQPAPSKRTPIYIQGDASYIETVQHITGIRDTELVQTRVADDGAYRVSKVTCMVSHEAGQIPVEIQFMAHNDHYNGWLGTAAHIFHKHGGGISMVEKKRMAKLLERINARMTKVDKKGMYVNERSQPSGERFMRGIYEGLGLSVDA